MSPFAYTSPAVWSFGLALIALGAFATQLAFGWRGGARASMLVGAVGVSAVWAAVGIGFAGWGADALWVLWRVADAVRSVAWSALVLLVLALGPARSEDRVRRRPLAVLGIALPVIVAVMWLFPGPPPGSAAAGGARLGFALSLGLE